MPSLGQLADDPARAAALSPEAATALLARCAVVQSALVTRLVSAPIRQNGYVAAAAEGDPLDEVRHLNTRQVAKLFHLEEAYVQQLCRTHKIPARKVGKYWRIPVAALREWADQQNRLDMKGVVTIPSQSDAR
ncbi:MAG: helix-turn-helix domain-containing protein, partial [Nitrospiraceae bacterium]